MTVTAAPPRSAYMNTKEAAGYIGKCTRTIKRYVEARNIPVYHPAGTRGYRFLRDELDAWLRGAELEVVFDSPAKGLWIRVVEDRV